MSVAEYLQQRQAALEAAWEKLRSRTCSPYSTKISDLCAMLQVREQLRNISEALGERNPDAGWAARFSERVIQRELAVQRVAAERKVQP